MPSHELTIRAEWYRARARRWQASMPEEDYAIVRRRTDLITVLGDEGVSDIGRILHIMRHAAWVPIIAGFSDSLFSLAYARHADFAGFSGHGEH